jgi:hypothetical protein
LKIGILTFHRCINYGSYWQSRCLAGELIQRGHQVAILDHQSKRVNLAEWKCALQPVLPTPVPVTDHPLYRQKIRKFFKAFESLPLSPAFPLEDPSLMEEYEMVIVGSDEVWNLSHPWYGYYPAFYGDGIRTRRLISYAASFGNYDVTWKPDAYWINKLHQFERISVRDENSRIIIQNILGIDPPMVLDPCLLFPPEITTTRFPFTPKKYIAVYGHNFTGSFLSNIRRWADENNRILISIGYRNEWADIQWLPADPFEFAFFMNQSQAVVTNFFHGCVFALLNSRPFICETSSYRSHKIEDLLRKVEGETHLVTGQRLPDISHLLNEPPEERIFQNIAQLRQFSRRFLDQALTHHHHART